MGIICLVAAEFPLKNSLQQAEFASIPRAQKIVVAFQQVWQLVEFRSIEPVKRFDFSGIRHRFITDRFTQPPGKRNLPRRDTLPNASLEFDRYVEFFTQFPDQSLRFGFV